MPNDKKQLVLIVSNSLDIHVDELEKHLASQGQDFFRLNLDKFPRDYDIALNATSQGEINYQFNHLPSNVSFGNKDIKSVWVRKKAPFSFVSDDLQPQEKAFAEQEAEFLLNGFLHSLDCYWMSHPRDLRASQWKVEQLSRASRYGFRVPDTLLSNNPEDVINFYHKHHQRIITKPISDSALAADKVEVDEIVAPGVMTTLITPEHIEHIEAVREFPCCFQQYIEKQFEVRATVIGDKIFSARIDSQADKRTAVDMRDFSVEIDYDAWQLPDAVASQCIEFVHSYGLQYGAMDLIYTPDNEFVFLENNPGGQFWFVEQLVPELRMMEHLAHCLVEARS